jgi:hypothetical protein
MVPVPFPQQTVVWAEHQPEYSPLPAYTDGQETISRWALTWRERLRVLVTGTLWLRQMNFGRALQPVHLGLDSPFETTQEP